MSCGVLAVRLAWLACAVVPVAAQKTYIGAAACGSCHPAQFAAQSAGGHARALSRTEDHPLAKSFPATSGPQALWAFGAGDQAVTFVSQIDEDSYLEHRLSYYSDTRTLGLTPGHRRGPASRGAVYPTFDPEARIMRCFQCHSTGPLTLGPKLELQPAEAGVRCEACHGAGSLHREAAGRGEVEAARKLIDNPRRLSAVEINQACGECHRKPAPAGAATNWGQPWNTRHQPLYLSQSACFLKSSGKLSCLGCHDPHQPLRKNDAAYYNGRCASCHGGRQHPPVPGASLSNCILCHMPRVQPQAHLRFTNHWIGVYRAGESLRPRRVK